jgi:hypothetical protein
MIGAIAVIAAYIRLGRQKELDQIRDELQKLQQERKGAEGRKGRVEGKAATLN